MRARRLLPLALAPILAACGAQTAPPAQSPSSVPSASMQREQIGADYLLVSPSADKGKSPKLQVAGTQYGVVVALPPGYEHAPGGGASAPLGSWTVYLAHPTGGKQNLLATAQRVAALPEAQTDLTIIGVTGRYALFTAKAGSGRLLDLLTIAGKGVGTLRGLGQVTASYGGALAVRDTVIYLDPGGTVHALTISTGKEITGPTASAPLFYMDGVLSGDGKAVALQGLTPPAQPSLPQGFQWISIAQDGAPVAAVPQGYVVKQIPGGSSHGVSATDPADSSVQVTVFENACAGCYNPGFMAQGTNTLSTPIYVGAQRGVTPLGDHGFISVTQGKHGVVQYQLVADYLNGGDLEADVSVPASDGALAQEILRTVRLPW